MLGLTCCFFVRALLCYTRSWSETIERKSSLSSKAFSGDFDHSLCTRRRGACPSMPSFTGCSGETPVAFARLESGILRFFSRHASASAKSRSKERVILGVIRITTHIFRSPRTPDRSPFPVMVQYALVFNCCTRSIEVRFTNEAS